jgi:hypothetical protein
MDLAQSLIDKRRQHLQRQLAELRSSMARPGLAPDEAAALAALREVCRASLIRLNALVGPEQTGPEPRK